MYKPEKYRKSSIVTCDKYEGEPIEWKIERILDNNEPILEETDLIYTDKAEGVRAEFNIKTDRFELASEGMDLIEKQRIAKGDAKAKKLQEEKEAKIVKLEPKTDSGAESTNGTSESN